MGNGEIRRTNDKTVGRQSDTENSGSKSYIERAKNGVGIAFVGALKAAEATMKVTTAGLAIWE